mgnify:CR=1 FL=1
MGVELVLSLLGGLALFMYGMQMMSTNLEAVAGNRMKQNRYDGWICQLGSYDT